MNQPENKKDGLILIELLLAMAIFTMSVVTIFSLFINATQGVILGLEKTRGFFLSNEALEAAAAIARYDQNYLAPGKYQVGINHENQWVLIPKTGLMGHFLLANNAKDSSIYKNQTIIKQISFFEDRKGQPQAAAIFNGTNSYIKTEYAFSLQIEGPLTLSAWVLDTSAKIGEPRTIAGRKEAYILSKQNHTYTFTIFGPEGNDSISAESDYLPWEQITGVYDPGGPTLRLYVNGKEKVARETNITAINRAPGREFFIGAEEDDLAGVINVWHGRISDVRIYKRSLTTNEIDGLYGSYSAPYEKSLAISNMDKLAGIWSFQEGEGCVVHDNSGNNNHGLIKNCSLEEQWVENRAKKPGRAYYFEPKNFNYIEVPDSPSLQIKEKISVSLWLKTPEELREENGVILHKRAAGSEDFSFALTYLGTEKGYGWAVSIGTPDQLNESISIGAAIPNRWQHIIATFNGTDKKIYIDNQEIYLDEGDLNFNNAGTNSHLFIGSNANGQDNPIGFTIDDLRIYNKVLDSIERQTIFLDKLNYYLE